MTSEPNSLILSFADDTRISRQINCFDDSLRLQEDLHKTYEWAKKNDMEFNEGKFEQITFQKDKTLSTPYTDRLDKSYQEKLR